jgi:hypothetical protein
MAYQNHEEHLVDGTSLDGSSLEGTSLEGTSLEGGSASLEIA